jgi:hypothetical protein
MAHAFTSRRGRQVRCLNVDSLRPSADEFRVPGYSCPSPDPRRVDRVVLDQEGLSAGRMSGRDVSHVGNEQSLKPSGLRLSSLRRACGECPYFDLPLTEFLGPPRPLFKDLLQQIGDAGRPADGGQEEPDRAARRPVRAENRSQSFGVEVIATSAPERLMSALAPVARIAPPLQPENRQPASTGEKSRPRHKPIICTGLLLAA